MSWNTKPVRRWFTVYFWRWCGDFKLLQPFTQKDKHSFDRDATTPDQMLFRCPIVPESASVSVDVLENSAVFCRKSELPSCSEGLGLCLKVNTVNPIYFSSAPLFLTLFPSRLVPQLPLLIPAARPPPLLFLNLSRGSLLPLPHLPLLFSAVWKGYYHLMFVRQALPHCIPSSLLGAGLSSKHPRYLSTRFK